MNCKPKKCEIVSWILFFVSLCSSLNFGRPIEMSFDGNGYLWHKLKPNENAEQGYPVKLSMWFKTKHPSGLLVVAHYQDDDGSMFAVALSDGKLRCIIPVTCDRNSTKSQMEITSIAASDGRWHLASIVHQGSVLTCQVDGFSKNITGVQTGMNGKMFIGGVPHNRTLSQSLWNNLCLPAVKNFSGCIGDLFIRNEYIDDIPGRQHLTKARQSACDHVGNGLMSLRDPQSLLIWQLQNTTLTVTSLDFQMRTSIKNGFIAKISSNQFVLSLFLMEGLIKAKLKLNTYTALLSLSKLDVADGRWHRITCYVAMAGKELTLSIDGAMQFRKKIPSITTRSQEVRRVGWFRIGGSLHQHQFFVGCVREVFINKVLLQPTDQRYTVESKNIVVGSCGEVSIGGETAVLRPKVNLTEGILNGRALSSAENENHNPTTKSRSKETMSTAAMFTTDPHLYVERNYTMSRSREENFKSNVTGSSEGVNTSNSSLPYLIAIATLVGVLVLLLFCVLGICARLKRCLCFKDSSKQPNEGDTCTDSASKKTASTQGAESESIAMVEQGALTLQTDSKDKYVGFFKNVDETFGTTEPYYFLNRQQARYWRERDEKLLDSQCRQHIENSPADGHPYVRHSLPPVFQLESTQSPKRRMTTTATPEVIIPVQDKGDTRKKAFTSKGTVVIDLKDIRASTDKASSKTNSKLSHRTSIEVKKPKGAEELPVKKKKRLGYGWAYGSRFARGADSSDTDCSDIERLSSHSRYKYRYGKSSHTGRPLRILEASETEEEQQSNDDRSTDGHNRKWARFGRKKKFGTFWDQGTRLLKVVSEEDKNQDTSKFGGQVKLAGEASLNPGKGQHQGSSLLTKSELGKEGLPEKRRDRQRRQNEKDRNVSDSLPRTSTYIKRGDPDGRPEIPHRLSSLVVADDATHLGNCKAIKDLHHDKSNLFQDHSKSSNLMHGPFPEKCYDVNSHWTGQELATNAATVRLNLEGAGCEAGPRQTVIIGGQKTELKAGVSHLHMRVPKDMLMQRANNLMGSDRSTII